jgi:sugar (pentulose or hexulose) kinase
MQVINFMAPWVGGAHVHRDRVFEPDAGRHAVYREQVARFRRLYPAVRDLVRGS